MGEIFSPTRGDSDLPKRGLTKRTYKPPTLYSYGTLRDITLHVANRINQDGGSNKNPHKTGPKG